MRPASVVLATLFATPFLGAQLAPPIHGLGRVTYAVADPHATAAFYGRLGFQTAFESALAEGGQALFVKVGDRQYIALTPRAKDRNGLLSVALDVDGADVIRDFYVQRRSLMPLPLSHTPAGNLGFLIPGPPTAPSGKPQRIEYIQYLAGSRQTRDLGQHLAPTRLADEILAVGIPFTNRSAARDFYLQKLDFELSAGRPWSVELPGPSNEQVLLANAEDRPRLYLHIATLEGAATALQHMGIPFRQVPGALEVHDPDGNLLEFESAHIPVAVGSAEK